MRRRLREAYRCLARPDLRFVEARLRRAPHARAIRRLLLLGRVAETTDLNVDVCQVLSLQAGPERLVLRLSLVGPYACAHRVDGELLSAEALAAGPLGRCIAGVLADESLDLLEPRLLCQPLLFGGRTASVYEALFSADQLVG